LCLAAGGAAKVNRLQVEQWRLGSSTVQAAGSYKGQGSTLYTVVTISRAVEVGWL